MHERSQPLTLAEVAGQNLNLLGCSAVFLYVAGACLTTGPTRWLMIVIATVVTVAATVRRRQIRAAEPLFTLAITVATSVLWGWQSERMLALGTAFVVASAVFAAWMLPRTLARVAIGLLPAVYTGAQLAAGVPGDVALQTVAMAATATALGALLLAIRITTERRFREHTRALAEVNDRLEELNRTDALTGLPNRRRLDETLDQAWQRASAEGGPISLLMVDIDHFKDYNDHYGHLGGDACLAKVAAALAAGIRDVDVVARFGGEEFSVILPDADRDLATRIAERIRGQITHLRAENPMSPDGFVSVSVGVASVVPAGDDTPRDLIKLADQALYEAKRNGRNRVEVSAAA